MSRAYSEVAEPHRVLKVDLKDPQRGRDVLTLQAAAKRRLEARGIERHFAVDGVFGPKTADALDTTIYFLGALDATVKAAELSIGAQRMVRYPGRRTDAQLARAESRMEQLLRDRKRHHQAGPRGGVSGLSASQRQEARDLAVRCFRMLYEHASVVHYTQSGARWEGIARGLRYADGRYPHYADCSSAYTWCLWNALTHVGGSGFADVVNGQSWAGGYTGTLLTHGERVDDLLPGDAVIYGTGWPGKHVAMYAGDGKVYSHGSEAGPYWIPVHYRSDVLEFQRFI